MSNLRPHLLSVYEESDDQEYCIANLRTSATDLGQKLKRYVTLAGCQMWKKPWQNLRSSRETELAENFPIQCVTSWIGNSPAVAQQHYLQVTEVHKAKALQQGVQSTPPQKETEQILPQDNVKP